MRPSVQRSVKIFYQKAAGIITTVALSAFYALPAQAAGSGMPWEAPLEQILQSIEGPVAKIIAVIVIKFRIIVLNKTILSVIRLNNDKCTRIILYYIINRFFKILIFTTKFFLIYWQCLLSKDVCWPLAKKRTH